MMYKHPFRNPDLSVKDRVKDLLGRLTRDEKIALLSETAPPIPRLGIDGYNHGNESLHGVVRPGSFTVFPRPMGLAATFNPKLIGEMASAIGDEARARYNELGHVCSGGKFGNRYNGLLTFWSPTVNMARDPRWGRTGETYGEDPLLTSRMGAEYVSGLQGDGHHIKAVATPKHFVANNEEHNRFSCKANIPERSLREYYLKGFEGCVKDGGALSIMAAYNAVNGVPCSVNPKLLNTILRDEWGFEGYVVGDLWSPKFVKEKHNYTETWEETAAACIKAGLDLDSGCKPYKHLASAIDQGLCTEEDVDRSLGRILSCRFRLGMFDPDENVSYNNLPPDTVGCELHQRLALQLARESLVLLKNEPAASGNGKLLPFDDSVKRIAVLGPCVSLYKHPDYSLEALSGGSPVTPIDGFRAICDKRNIELTTVNWDCLSSDSVLRVIDGKYFTPLVPTVKEPYGLTAHYFDNTDLSGEPFGVRVDSRIDINRQAYMPDDFVNRSALSIRWQGRLAPPVSGTYSLDFKWQDGLRLRINDLLLIDHWDQAGSQTIEIDLQADTPVDILIEYRNTSANAVVKCRWAIPQITDYDPLDAISEELDAVILVMGLDGNDTGEGRDRMDLNLPQQQSDIIRKVYERNPNVVLVLMNGTAVAINWEKAHLPAILEAWYPGEKAGQALTEVLWGMVNPGGKLPLTFYRSTEDLPPFNDYDISHGRTYQYFDGDVLFEFGHGLSYTTFAYANLRVEYVNDRDAVRVSFDLKNTGEREGDEVIQVYARYRGDSPQMPIKQLKAFQRVHLASGTEETVEALVPLSDFSYYCEKEKRFAILPGEWIIQVGASSKDIRLEERMSRAIFSVRMSADISAD